MFRPRVIPCLLLHNRGLAKTKKFKNPIYVGDPINAVKIFNDSEADELVFLDITATIENRNIPLDLIKEIADEAFMPFAVGGGIKTVETINKILKSGAEKVVINSAAIENPKLIRQSSKIFGSQSIVVSIDVKKSTDGVYEVMTHAGTQRAYLDPVSVSLKMESLGAGEILINSIDRDGTRAGYDIDLIKKITEIVRVPVIALGGADRLEDFVDAVVSGGASAVAAGSMFVFLGKKNAVLINYPEKHELELVFNSKL